MAISQEQREARRNWIGASEVSAMLGLDPHLSEYDLWRRKTGQLIEDFDIETIERMFIGELMEPVVARLLTRRHQRVVVVPNETFHHPTCRYLAANIDLMYDVARRGSDVIEVKNTGGYDWGRCEDDSDIPMAARLQVQSQLSCADSHRATIAVMLARRGQHLVELAIEADRDMMRRVADEAGVWWERHIIGGTPPPLDRQPYETLARLPVARATRVRIESSLMDELVAARLARSEAERREDEARLAVARAIGDSDHGEDDNGRYVYFRGRKQHRLDAKALSETHPDLVAKFTSEVTTTRFVSQVYGAKP